MRVQVTGRNLSALEPSLKKLGMEIVEKNPDVIISFGGDGTLLASERKYPAVPKLPIRNSLVCNKCSHHTDSLLLSKLLTNKLRIMQYQKLHTKILGQDFYALNDFVIRNQDAIHAIRFQVTVSSHPELDSGSIHSKFYIGDGIILSTPFGSTGYFKSVTGKTFKSNFALAFNNTTQKMSPKFFKKSDQVVFKLIRGKATLTFDNSPDIYIIPEGMKLTFKLSQKVAKIYGPSSLRCPNCKVKRG